MIKRRVRYLPVVGLSVNLGLVIYVGYALRDYTVDDAYITFRHAKNLLAGAGFSFNPHDRLLSTTSPLHGLLLATLEALFGLNEYGHLTILMSTVSMVLLCLATFGLLSHTNNVYAGLVSVLLIATQHWFYRFFALETILALSLNVAAIAFVAKRRWTSAGLISGLSVVARPDAAVVVIIIAAYSYFLQCRGGAKYIASTVGIVLIWVSIAWAYYGSPLPNTLAAKSGFGVLVFGQAMWPKILGALFTTHPWVSTGIVLSAALGIVWTLHDRSVLMVLPAWALAHTLGYTVLQISFPFAWYYAPIIYVTLVMASYGLTKSAHQLQAWLRAEIRGHLQASLVGLVYSSLGLALTVIGWLGLSDSLAFTASYPTDLFSGARDRVYHQVAAWLEHNTKPTDRIGVAEIGVIGYFSDRTIVDFYGLATRELRDFPKTEDWIGAIKLMQPDYVISVRTLPPDPPFDGLGLSEYVEVLFLPKNDTSNLYQDIVIYRRID